LRAVQEGEFERVGSSVTLKTDVRLIVASNRQLDAEVRAGRFRPDLWYRLNIFPITVPPLRQRAEDLPVLVAYFMQKHCLRLGRPLLDVSRATMSALQVHAWPGNVRELENVIERAAIVSRGKWAEILVDDAKVADLETSSSVQPASAAGQRTLDDLQREHIRVTLEGVQWRVEGRGGAAQVLGLNPNTLRSRMRKLGISRPGSSPAGSHMH
jgi:formate hydrogenlyase transcriptional activator